MPQPVCRLGRNSTIGAPKGSTGAAGLESTRQRRTISAPFSSTVGAGTPLRVSIESGRLFGETITNSLRA